MEALLVEGQHIWHAHLHTQILYLTHLGQVITKSNFGYSVKLKLAGDLLSVGLLIQKSFFAFLLPPRSPLAKPKILQNGTP